MSESSNFQTLTPDNKLRKMLVEQGSGATPVPGQLVSSKPNFSSFRT